MDTAIAIKQVYQAPKAHTVPIFSQFFSWCANQDKNRILWTGVILIFHGCAITPITGLVIVSTGNHIGYWVAASAAMAMALVPNLASLSTKITIPVFLLTIAIDIAVIGGCLLSTGS